MRAFKTFFSFSIPLIAMLLSFSIYLIVDKGVVNYKQSIINDYSIVIVSKKELTKYKLEQQSIEVKTLKLLPKENIVNDLNKSLSKKSIELLHRKLPFFYKLYLDDFPTQNELEKIKSNILNIQSISQVEVFTKDHNQLYSLLLLTQNITNILFFVLVLFALLILLKQVKIWFYEHHERIAIMKLHGASLFYCAKPLIKIAIYSSIVASVIVLGLTYLFLENFNSIVPEALSQLTFFHLPFGLEFYKIALLSLIISLGTVFTVLIKHKFHD